MLASLFFVGLLEVLLNGESFGTTLDGKSSHRGSYLLGSRHRRTVIYQISSAVVDGMRATTTLLRGATRLPSKEKYLKRFQKSGSYDKAVTDFFSVEPIDVREFFLRNVHKRTPAQSPGSKEYKAKGIFGVVGDRTILIQDKFGPTGQPIMKIIWDLPSGRRQENVITYIED